MIVKTDVKKSVLPTPCFCLQSYFYQTVHSLKKLHQELKHAIN